MTTDNKEQGAGVVRYTVPHSQAGIIFEDGDWYCNVGCNNQAVKIAELLNSQPDSERVGYASNEVDANHIDFSRPEVMAIALECVRAGEHVIDSERVAVLEADIVKRELDRVADCLEVKTGRWMGKVLDAAQVLKAKCAELEESVDRWKGYADTQLIGCQHFKDDNEKLKAKCAELEREVEELKEREYRKGEEHEANTERLNEALLKYGRHIASAPFNCFARCPQDECICGLKKLTNH